MFSLSEYLRQKPAIALVGASNDRSKYGNIIFHDLLHKGFEVFPVNPRVTTIEGYKAYKNLQEVTKQHEIGIVVFVVPPEVTLGVLQEALELGLKRVWIQPGAGDEKVRIFLEENDFHYVMDACIMIMSWKG